ncbi:MAG: dihydroorotate dehydrogenase electron transfer subunit [Thermoplasmata archaeon]|nr:dihydroorotate dehydrogenase electron transfer subunit [Thermoplasmata archaeon]
MRTVVEVTEAVVETPSTITLRFRYGPPADPGQFVMVWLPGDDELPMSLSYTEGPSKGVTIKAMGDTSRRVLALRRGARVGVRGPYGNRFDLSPRRILVVGGGSGTAVLAPAAERALHGGAAVTVALGATRAAELLFRDRLRSAGARVEVATDDGSEGVRGYVTALAATLLDSESFDAVWTCGPEVMMQKVVAAARPTGVPVFCSVERHMKCALGMCDACALGRFHVCIDGPVFPADLLVTTEDFARFHRDPSGRRVLFGPPAPA